MAETTVAEVTAELAALEARRHERHGVHLGRLRALAKGLKTQQELARQLWQTHDTAAGLLAILI